MAEIGVDIDGIIAETDSAFRKRMSEVFKRDFPRNKVTEFNYEKCFNLEFNETTKFYSLFLDEKLWLNINLIRGARPALTKLKRSHSIILITGRPIEIKNTTEKWLNRKKIPFDKLHFMQGQQKNEVARLNGYKFSLFIEDHPDYALQMAEDGVKVILMDYPWNQKLTEHPGITRTKNWKEINQVLKENNFF